MPASARFTLRPATTADLGTIADNLVEGFATYRRWAPVTWSPPNRLEMLTALLQRFTREGSSSVLAFEGATPAGHMTVRPERDADDQPLDGVARLTHLFVREPYWGSGVADELHDAMRATMLERGLPSGRLWTPIGQARARAFYERHGWQATGALDPDNALGLELLEYALDLR